MFRSFNNFFYLDSRGGGDRDSDWRLQNELTKQNDVYKMVSLQGGGKGDFLTVFQDGPDKLIEYFKENVEKEYLYNDSEIITEELYKRWVKQQRKFAREYLASKESNLEVQIETLNPETFSTISLDTVIKPYEEHHVKWRLDKRGAVGETPIHLLFLHNTKVHIDMAECLLNEYPQMAMDLYEGKEYYGETCLHFAIIQQNIRAVKILLDTKCVDLHARAKGKFFIPVNIKRGDIKLKKDKYEGYAYYGEYPLSFAASIGNRDIYDILLQHGADPYRKDSYGNNVLHLTVIHNQPDMYYYATTHSVQNIDPNETNSTNLTPLSLAAKLGKNEMFQKILDISSKQYWCFNTVTCSAFPLKSLDTILPDGETDWNSALMNIIEGKKDSHLDMVENSVILDLLTKKWKLFGKRKFLRLLSSYVFHIIFLSVAVYLRPHDQQSLRYGTTSEDIARYVFESLTVLIAAIAVYYMCREIYLESIHGFYRNVISIPARIFYFTACLLIVVCVIFRFTELYDVEDWLLVFAVPGMWSYFLFFLRNSSVTGPFITMIYRMVATDIARFAVIYLIILLTSGMAFYYQFEGRFEFAFLTELGTFMTLVLMSFGEFEYNSILQAKYYQLSVILFILFMIFVHILLLNMLIAMMTRTFDKIQKRSEKIWKRQWASMVITMERSHNNQEKMQFQGMYDLNFNAARVTEQGEANVPLTSVQSTSLPSTDIRAFMVVQNQPQTESERRLTLRRVWKKAGKKALSSDDDQKSPPPEPAIIFNGRTGLGEMIKEINEIPDDDEEPSFFERAKSAMSEMIDDFSPTSSPKLYRHS